MRFTPTAVGNTYVFQGCNSESVHPHACGEYRCAAPPCNRPRRFTPTAVGNTRDHRSGRSPVHPHACGEYFSPPRVGRSSGSPPRLWGIRMLLDVTRPPCGSPPRLWGIRHAQAIRFRCTSVHPHACGEYAMTAIAAAAYRGSPPRLWGIRWQRVTATRPDDGSPPRLWGILRLAVLYAVLLGSPPRLWGIPLF